LSADNDARKLRLLLERIGLDPERVVELATKDPDRLGEMLVGYAARMKRKGQLDSTIVKSLGGLRSYLTFRHVKFDSYPKLEPIQAASLARERVPSPEELGRVLERLTLRGRSVALLMAHTGLRPGVLGNYGGDRGLVLGDLTELDIAGLKFKEIPFVVRVPANLSKTRVSYVSFGTGQLARALIAYLAERREAGEKLAPDSPVIRRRPTERLRGVARQSTIDAEHRFLRTTGVTQEVAEALHASVPQGVTWRAYVLRSYCSTRLMLGPMGRDLREAILGHDGGIASRYNVGKRWGDELLAEARREYANASEFLETSTQGKTNVAAEFRRTLLDVAGLPEEEVGRHMKDSNEELLAILRVKLLGGQAGAASKPVDGVGRGTQRPVSLSEAERLLAEGWTFVASFGPGRVLLQPP
jgi:integrase